MLYQAARPNDPSRQHREDVAMPTIQNPTLKLTKAFGTSPVRVDVAYVVTFSPVELFLLANGLVIQERIHLIGDDEAASGGAPVYSTPPEPLAPGPGEVQITRTKQLSLSKGQLDEDPGTAPLNWGGFNGTTFTTPNADELIARIELNYVGLTARTQADTAVAVLSPY
jgi:hypothetical protein